MKNCLSLIRLTVVFMLMSFAVPAMAQTVLSGTVKDANGEPLPGVAVSTFSNGRIVGTMTDIDGAFKLSAKDNSILEFSCVGFATQSVKAVSGQPLAVVLEMDKELLEEVVVVGFATQKKINLTGAVGTMDSKAFESVPVQNAVQALQGKVPGLQITSSSGQLNSRQGIQIRGLATIGQGSYGQALILIDGMEGDLHSINPQDIENISVLKDASASSVYGSRAPFGVILITTKSGSKGKAQVNYNNSFRFSNPINMPTMMDSYTWATFMNDAARNSGAGDWIAPETMQRIRDYMDGKIDYNTIPMTSNPNAWNSGYDQANDNVDYYKVFYKSLTKEQEHNVSISGGNERMTYYLSGNILSQDGYLNWGGDGLTRYNASGRFTADVKPWLSMSYQARFTRTDYFQPSVLNNDQFYSEIGRQSWPIGPVYDPNGNLYNDHVLRMHEGGRATQEGTIVSQQASLIIKPLAGWRIVGDFNYRYTGNFNDESGHPVSQLGVDGVTPISTWYRNYYYNYSDKNDYMNINVTSDYEKLFDNGHYFKVLAGFQAENSHTRYHHVLAWGLISKDSISIDSASGLGEDGQPQAPRVGGGSYGYSTAGFFGRINYNYKERYLVELNFRADGSSRFRKGSRWGYFPSASLGWNIANEGFIADNTDKVDMLKLRISSGSLGNQYTSSLYPTYAPIGYSREGSPWLIDGKPTNASWAPSLISPTLTWETVVSSNVGLDWGFLNNRLTGSFDYFIRQTKNMVGPSEELPVILGAAVPVANNTDLVTKGFELELSWKDTIGKDFSYGARFVLSDAVSKVTRYSNPSETLSNYYAGMTLGEFWGYETIGIAKSDEEMQEHLASLPNGGQTFIGLDWAAGDVMYKDLNGDGKIDGGANTINDHGDKKVIGNTTPRFNYGLDLFFNWKGIDFSMFLQGVGSRQYFQNTYFFWGSYRGGWWTTGTTVHEDYFRDDPEHHLGVNLDSYYPRPLWNTFKNYETQTRYMQDASYLRLKNLQLGYTLPSQITQKIGIEKIRVFFSGENLATFTKMSKLYDPETIGTNMCIAYPLSRTFSFGVSVTL